MGAPEIRPYRSGDEAGILATWNLVHAGQGRARTLDDWRWAFGENPSGSRIWVAMDGGRCLAHYATRPHRARVDGEERVFALVVDAMVHPDHRRGIGTPTLLAEAARALLAETCATDKDLLTYCWPDFQGWRREKQGLESELVRRESPLEAPPGDGPEELPPGIEGTETFDDSVAELYQRCAGEWNASQVRDARHLDWRVSRHPDRPYQVLVRKGAEGLAGQAIVSRAGWPRAGVCAIVDWLVPSEDTETGDLLIEGARALARRAGTPTLLANFPQWTPWFQHFQKRGFVVTASDLVLSGRNSHPRHDMFWLRDNWWYQPLDFEA